MAKSPLIVRFAAGLLAFWAPFAGAQQATPLDPKEFAARSITRLALLDLRTNTRPTVDDYRLAGHLLAIAHEITPDDREILRCRLEAAYACGDGDLVLELTSNLLNQDHLDTVAQLRLITARIARNTQNAEDRIGAYERFLDPAGPGKAIDPSVLSRLALDEALLLRERGDDAGFIRKLTQATQLDSTHKEAAQLAATVFAERKPEDRIGCLRMIENVLMADPVDGNLHLSIAHELVAGGAYKAAERFLANAQIIFNVAGQSTERLELEAYVLRWRSHGPADVVAQLNHELATARDAAARRIEQLQAKGLPIEQAPKPDEVRLSPQLRFLYIAGLDASGESQAAHQAVAELAADISKIVTQLRDRAERGEVSREQVARAALEYASQIQTARLWMGQDVDAASKDLAAGDAFKQASPDLAAILNGWLAVRSGEYEQARDLLQPYTRTAPLAQLGVGLSYELAGQKDQALAAYLQVAREQPLDVMGAWAITRAQAVGYKPDAAFIAALEGVVRDIPQFVDNLVRSPQEFGELRVEAIAQVPDAIDRVRVHITLQNLSAIPMALGPDRTISSRLLMAPKLEASGRLSANLTQPEVIDLDRRLRLMPQEKLEADIWPDAGQTGWLMECIAARTVRIRWRVIQGFRMAGGGGFLPGIMGLTADTGALVRRPLAELTLPPDALATKFATEPASILPRLAATVRAFVLEPIFVPPLAPVKDASAPAAPEPKAPPTDVNAAVVAAIVARYPKADAVDRAMLAAVLPHSHLAPSMAPVDQVMRAEIDPVPLCIVLATRVVDPADELLVKCAQSEDPRVKDMAALVKLRLEAGAKTYAKFTPTEIKAVPAPLPAEAPPAAAPPADPPGAAK